MNQAGELARVKARIKALAEKTVSNGCTEAEAMSAAAMVGRLLERYALTMDEIDIRESVCVQIEIPVGGRQRRPIDGCVTAIARFCDCKVWLAREPDLRYVFFGFEADTTLAAYLFAVIDRAMRNSVAAFRTEQARLAGVKLRRASTSFQQGMAARVAERLEAMHRAREASVAAQRSRGTALILVKHRVVDDAFRQTAIRLVSAGRRSGMAVNGAFRRGQEAGDRIDLHRPLGEGSGRRLIG